MIFKAIISRETDVVVASNSNLLASGGGLFS